MATDLPEETDVGEVGEVKEWIKEMPIITASKRK